MSFPNIPNVTPSISLARDQVINLLLASIAFEELGLAHIINAEGEKIQAVLGTLPGLTVATPTLSNLLAVNNSVSRTLRNVIKKEMLLEFKLEDLIDLIGPAVLCPCTVLTLDANVDGDLEPMISSVTVQGGVISVVLDVGTIVPLGNVADFTTCTGGPPVFINVPATITDFGTFSARLTIDASGTVTGTVTENGGPFDVNPVNSTATFACG